MLKGHLPRVIYHQVYWYTKRNSCFLSRAGSGLGLRVSGFGFRSSGSGFPASGFGFQASGSGFWVRGFGLWVKGRTATASVRHRRSLRAGARRELHPCGGLGVRDVVVRSGAHPALWGYMGSSLLPGAGGGGERESERGERERRMGEARER